MLTWSEDDDEMDFSKIPYFNRVSTENDYAYTLVLGDGVYFKEKYTCIHDIFQDYKKLARKFHPTKGGDARKFQIILDLYQKMVQP